MHETDHAAALAALFKVVKEHTKLLGTLTKCVDAVSKRLVAVPSAGEAASRKREYGDRMRRKLVEREAVVVRGPNEATRDG